MAYRWTAQQFVGGTVALDWVNTVCYYGDPSRQFDKISTADDLSAFQDAALLLSDARDWCGVRPLPGDAVSLALCREIRAATDTLFRPLATGAAVDTRAFQRLLRWHGDLLEGQNLRCSARGLELDPDAGPSFALTLTQSALRLAHSAEIGRIHACPNCRWLFIDRSRNGSRVWCDMLTCGNRAKADRHQRRIRARQNAKPARRIMEV